MDYNKVISLENPGLNDIVFCRFEDKLSTNLDQETVILDMKSGVYSQLNPVGTTIWEILTEPVSFGDILETLLTTYKTTEEECVDDLIYFLQTLSENKLINII